MSDFEKVKQHLDLLSVITQETGLSMKGKHLSACPFCGGHECFSIKDQRYHCFQCPEKGDVFTFIQRKKGMTDVESLHYLALAAGIDLPKPGPKDSSGVNLTNKELIFLEASKHYNANIDMNGGREYLLDKRKHHESVISSMQVGYATGDLVEHLRSKGFSDDHIKASGLAKEKEVRGQTALVDFFKKGLIIFPHLSNKKVLHFTMKDPDKKLKYQLPNSVRAGGWKFYNQDALTKYNEIIVVEGENDLLSVMSAGVQNVIGLIGQPSESQIKALGLYCRKKHLYLFLDNDEGGEKFIRQICIALNGNIRIMQYNEGHKDPDEYLRAYKELYDAEQSTQLNINKTLLPPEKEIKRLLDESVDYVTWEISRIAKLDDLGDRNLALKEKKIFQTVAGMVEIEKLVFIEKLMKLGFTREAIEEQLEINHELRQSLAVYFEKVPRKDADPNYVADLIFRSMSETGRFFRDRSGNVFLLYQHHIYEIGNNRPFNALIKKLTNLLPTKEPGRSVWESLASEAYNSGLRIDIASWLSTDRAHDIVYANLNSPDNMIMKIGKSMVEEIPNGMNPEGVLLRSSGKIMPVNYHPDADIKEGMRALKELVFDNFTCDVEQRYFILCWFISAFMLDYCPYMGLMKFSGPTSSGKTTAAKLISLLVYGNEHLGDTSAAAAYAVSSQNPLLIIDNLESDDFTKSIMKFLLLSATKGGKEKRSQGTDSGTVQEMPKALVLITAIEPFTKAELINRTYDIDFLYKYKADDFVEDECIGQIIKKRDLILSALIMFLSKDVLPNIEKRKEHMAVLKKEHKGHAKNRTDEYLAMLLLMLEKLLDYIQYYEEGAFQYGLETGEREIRHAWIDNQNEKARDTERTSNVIIKLMDGLVREYIAKMKDQNPVNHEGYNGPVWVYTHPEYLLEIVKTPPEFTHDEEGEYALSYIEFIATSEEIVLAFDRYCKNNGIKNPYKSASVFGSRLRNDLSIMKKSGWELVVKDTDKYPYWKMRRGERFYKFRKTIVR